MALPPALVVIVLLQSCSGKDREFASGTAAPVGSGLPVRPVSADSGSPAAVANGDTESQALPGALSQPGDGGASALAPASAEACGDACSGACAPGATSCASLTERVECGVDALWGQPVACPNVCLEGACAGECPPGASECVSTTRARSCSDQGVWSEPADCTNACVGTACAGDCRPGQTRCETTTTVQVCSDQGQWGPVTACQNACAGDACTGECVPGAARCSSETQVQSCNELGQFGAPTPCPFACVDGACTGECVPGSGRCNPDNGVPQFCGNTGIWQSQVPCQFVCTGSGTCGGECAPGSRRCSPLSGVPQLCSAAGAWENQAACPFSCTDGACGGECTPGSRRCEPTSGLPQLCSNSSTWQSEAPCARGCQNGACAPLLELGVACGAGNDCASGFCTDGVCCQSSCGGPCAQCTPGTGACVMPATDTACAEVSCPSDECQVSAGNLTTNLCRTLGQCKDTNDCSTSGFDRGTPCDTATSDSRLCDGTGNCVDPTVTCNGATGQIVGEANVCCERREGSDPFTVTATYGPAADCSDTSISSPGATRVACDGAEDCRTGNTCCIFSAPGGSGIECTTSSCSGAVIGVVAFSKVCASPSGFSDTCDAGQSCTPSAELSPGWSICR